VEGNRTILVYGLPIVTLIVLGVMLLHGPFPAAAKVLLYIMLFLASVFMIFLVLIQRGKGGGLAGALGGMGGSSAFGTRAGDVFTMITIVVASFWILSAMGLAKINLADAKGGSSKFQGAPAKKTPGVSPKPDAEDTGATESESSETPASDKAGSESAGDDKARQKPNSDDNESN
jgi:preprotein translocase subunit SecG